MTSQERRTKRSMTSYAKSALKLVTFKFTWEYILKYVKRVGLRQDKCREVVCVPGKILVDKECKPILQKTSGYGAYMDMSVTVLESKEGDYDLKEVFRDFAEAVMLRYNIEPIGDKTSTMNIKEVVVLAYQPCTAQLTSDNTSEIYIQVTYESYASISREDVDRKLQEFVNPSFETRVYGFLFDVKESDKNLWSILQSEQSEEGEYQIIDSRKITVRRFDEDHNISYTSEYGGVIRGAPVIDVPNGYDFGGPPLPPPNFLQMRPPLLPFVGRDISARSPPSGSGVAITFGPSSVETGKSPGGPKSNGPDKGYSVIDDAKSAPAGRRSINSRVLLQGGSGSRMMRERGPPSGANDKKNLICVNGLGPGCGAPVLNGDSSSGKGKKIDDKGKLPDIGASGGEGNDPSNFCINGLGPGCGVEVIDGNTGIPSGGKSGQNGIMDKNAAASDKKGTASKPGPTSNKNGFGPGPDMGGIDLGPDMGGMGPGPNMGDMGSGPDVGGMGPGPDMGGMGPGPDMSGMEPAPDMGSIGPGPDMGGMGLGPEIGGMGPGPDMGGMGPGPNNGGTGPGPDVGGMGTGPDMGGMGSGPDMGGIGQGPDMGGVGPGAGMGGMGPGPSGSSSGAIGTAGIGLGGQMGIEVEIKSPEIEPRQAPEVKMPEIEMKQRPEIKTPEIKIPEINTPEIKTPEIEPIQAIEIKVPEIEPQQGPEIEGPGFLPGSVGVPMANGVGAGMQINGVSNVPGPSIDGGMSIDSGTLGMQANGVPDALAGSGLPVDSGSVGFKINGGPNVQVPSKGVSVQMQSIGTGVLLNGGGGPSDNQYGGMVVGNGGMGFQINGGSDVPGASVGGVNGNGGVVNNLQQMNGNINNQGSKSGMSGSSGASLPIFGSPVDTGSGGYNKMMSGSVDPPGFLANGLDKPSDGNLGMLSPNKMNKPPSWLTDGFGDGSSGSGGGGGIDGGSGGSTGDNQIKVSTGKVDGNKGSSSINIEVKKDAEVTLNIDQGGSKCICPPQITSTASPQMIKAGASIAKMSNKNVLIAKIPTAKLGGNTMFPNVEIPNLVIEPVSDNSYSSSSPGMTSSEFSLDSSGASSDVLVVAALPGDLGTSGKVNVKVATDPMTGNLVIETTPSPMTGKGLGSSGAGSSSQGSSLGSVGCINGLGPNCGVPIVDGSTTGSGGPSSDASFGVPAPALAAAGLIPGQGAGGPATGKSAGAGPGKNVGGPEPGTSPVGAGPGTGPGVLGSSIDLGAMGPSLGGLGPAVSDGISSGGLGPSIDLGVIEPSSSVSGLGPAVPDGISSGALGTLEGNLGMPSVIGLDGTGLSLDIGSSPGVGGFDPSVGTSGTGNAAVSAGAGLVVDGTGFVIKKSDEDENKKLKVKCINGIGPDCVGITGGSSAGNVDSSVSVGGSGGITLAGVGEVKGMVDLASVGVDAGLNVGIGVADGSKIGDGLSGVDLNVDLGKVSGCVNGLGPGCGVPIIQGDTGAPVSVSVGGSSGPDAGIGGIVAKIKKEEDGDKSGKISLVFASGNASAIDNMLSSTSLGLGMQQQTSIINAADPSIQQPSIGSSADLLSPLSEPGKSDLTILSKPSTSKSIGSKLLKKEEDGDGSGTSSSKGVLCINGLGPGCGVPIVSGSGDTLSSQPGSSLSGTGAQSPAPVPGGQAPSAPGSADPGLMAPSKSQGLPADILGLLGGGPSVPGITGPSSSSGGAGTDTSSGGPGTSGPSIGGSMGGGPAPSSSAGGVGSGTSVGAPGSGSKAGAPGSGGSSSKSPGTKGKSSASSSSPTSGGSPKPKTSSGSPGVSPLATALSKPAPKAKKPNLADRCLVPGVLKYSRSGGCNSYFKCIEGISVPACCPKGYKYDEDEECKPVSGIADDVCDDDCDTPGDLDTLTSSSARKD
nr:N-U5 [Pinctada fucata]